jgi:hypothetical protein
MTDIHQSAPLSQTNSILPNRGERGGPSYNHNRSPGLNIFSHRLLGFQIDASEAKKHIIVRSDGEFVVRMRDDSPRFYA